MLRYGSIVYIALAVLTLALFCAFAIATLLYQRKVTSHSRTGSSKRIYPGLLTALYVLTAIFSGCFFLVLSAFDSLPWAASAFLTSLSFFIIWALQSEYTPHLIRAARGRSYSLLSGEITRPVVKQVLLLVACCAFWFFLAWASSHICVSVFPVHVSTRITRPASKDVCLQRDPCHVYLTVGSDLAHELILHVHSSHKYGDLFVAMSTQSRPDATSPNEYEMHIKAEEHEISGLETPRFVYYIALTNLTADTNYYFRVVDSIPLNGYKPVFTRQYSFLTGPPSGPSSAPFSFVTGGDMGVSENTGVITGVAAEQNPLFVAMGGDLAYDNSMPACYRVWDAWFDMLADKLVSSSGKITPYLVAPGNHEAGNFWQTDASLFSLFRPYFVQEPLNGRNPRSMTTYTSHKIGSLLLMSLDSDVYVSAEEQTSWMESTLRSATQRWLTAIYHAPMWPSVRKIDDPISVSIRAAWGPIFEKFGLDMAFENHDHAYKRTKPMMSSTGPSPNATRGTLHVGDGKWGLGDSFREPTLRHYNAFVSPLAFVLHVQVNDTALSARAIGLQGDTIDSFTFYGFSPSGHN